MFSNHYFCMAHVDSWPDALCLMLGEFMKRDLVVIALTAAFLFMGLRSGYPATPEKMYTRNSDKVVLLHMVGRKQSGICSGAFIDKDGLILTCAHCFEGHPTKTYIKTDSGAVVLAIPLRIDKERDLAVLWTGLDNTPFFPLGDTVKVGQRVYAFGSPLGIQSTMSIGYVENLGKHLIIHSAFVSPGNSGGPLVNEAGQLVGINEAIVMVNVFMPAQGLFIAINDKQIRDFLGMR